jgi:predicted RNA-binding Zn-ribbon protein involved in translation (DUF1610 family)
MDYGGLFKYLLAILAGIMLTLAVIAGPLYVMFFRRPRFDPRAYELLYRHLYRQPPPGWSRIPGEPAILPTEVMAQVPGPPVCEKCGKPMDIYDIGLDLKVDRVYYAYRCGNCGEEMTRLAEEVRDADQI